jgi:hypothetical protein
MLSTVLGGVLTLFFLAAWWRVTSRATAKGTLMAVVLFSLAATVLTLIVEIGRLTAAVS